MSGHGRRIRTGRTRIDARRRCAVRKPGASHLPKVESSRLCQKIRRLATFSSDVRGGAREAPRARGILPVIAGE
ncbi:hypothetical protein DP43_4690 [Burkholderia pseudomallei]|nr:hypothetical protein DP43_4690 [Burkholderia pseudomallei]